LNCLNCNTEVNSNFCPNCGQKASTERITFKSFSKHLASDLIDTDKGILFNLKNLTLRPGKSVNDYISGKRKHIFNPISYALLAITVYLILSDYFGYNIKLTQDKFDQPFNQLAYDLGIKTGAFINRYIKFFFLLHIVYLSLVERFFFPKKNIYELMTMNAFIVGHAVIIGILFYPIFRIPLIVDPFVYSSILVLSYFVFKKNYSKIKTIALLLFSIFISTILLVFIPVPVMFILTIIQ